MFLMNTVLSLLPFYITVNVYNFLHCFQVYFWKTFQNTFGQHWVFLYHTISLLLAYYLHVRTKFSLHACMLENWGAQKLLGVTIDRKFNFNEHFTTLCDKASRKTQALTRIFPYIPQTQKALLINAYFMYQLGCCSLVWMNHTVEQSITASVDCIKEHLL